VWSPHEARLSDLIEDTRFSNPITAYLANDEDDSAFVGRMKNVLEGMALGGLADTIIGGAMRSKAIRKVFRKSITAGQPTAEAHAVKAQLEDTVLKRQRVEELDIAVENLETARTAGTTDPVADNILLGREALEQEKAVLDAADPRVAEIDEALSHIDGAEARGINAEDVARDMNEAWETPIENIAKANPEAASKISQNAKGARDALRTEREAAAAELAQSETDLVRDLADPESMLNKMDPDTLAEATAIIDDVPDAVRAEVDAARAEMPDAARVASDAAASKALREAAAVEAREALGDGPDVFRMENGKVVMDEEGVLARMAERRRKRVKTRQVIDMTDPVWYRAVTAIFKQAHNAVDEIDVNALATMSNINLERVAGENGGLKAVQAEISDFIKAHMNIGVKGGRSIKETSAIAERMVKEDAEALGDPALAAKFLENLERNFHDNLKDLDVHLMSLRMLTQSALLEARLAGTAVANRGGLEHMTRYIHSVQVFTRLEALREGTLSAVGRTLGAQRGVAKAVPVLRRGMDNNFTEASIGEAESIIRQMGGEDAVRTHAKQMMKVLDSPGARRAQLRESIGVGGHFGRVVLETWLNFILSSPVTHTVNTLANNTVLLYLPAEQIFSGAFAQFGRAGTRKIGKQLMTDGLHKYGGLVEGYRAAFRLGEGDMMQVLRSLKESYTGQAGAYEKARHLIEGSETMGTVWKSLATGEGQLIPDAKQFDFHTQNALTSSNTSDALRTSGYDTASKWTAEGTVGGRMIDALGNFIRTSGRGLTVGDELAKTVNYTMELHSLAFRDAIENNVADITAHIAKFKRDIPSWKTNPDIDRPTRLLWEELDTTAKKAAKYATFTDPLEGIEKSVQAMVVKHPYLRVAVPFIRTPANLMNFSLGRTPLAILNPRYREAFYALGKVGKDTPEFAAMRARVTIGTGVMTMFALGAAEGKFTGSGPANYEEKQALLATGWQANSFVIDNDDGSQSYISYSRLEPFSLPLQMAATYGEMSGQMGEVELMDMAASMTIGLAEAIKSKSYFSGLVEIIAAMDNPKQKLPKLWERLTSSFVPAGVNHINRVYFDDTMREVSGVMEAFKAKLPGYSKDLPPRRNIFGEPVTWAMGLGPDTVSPFMTRTSANDAVNAEFQRLVDSFGFGMDMSAYRRFEGVELTPQERDRYITMTAGDPSRNGTDIRAALRKLFKTNRYRSAFEDDDGKGALIKKLFTDKRARARKVMLRESEDLRKRVRDSKRKAQHEVENAKAKADDENTTMSAGLRGLLGN
jgi:hypothetical protein